ncbi:MAG: hypothetical protein LBB81_03980 [Treponema sp.]|jgi:hypothetical protein|nr:hypothetical protein [Treponema sp.]
MIQLYFLSILCNGLCAYILLSGSDNDTESVEKSMRFSIKNPTFHLVLGILTTVTGVLKLLSPAMDTLPILGDLVPSVSGIGSGLLMIFGIYRRGLVENSGTLDRMCEALLRFRKQIGTGLLAVTILHFLFPAAFFL